LTKDTVRTRLSPTSPNSKKVSAMWARTVEAVLGCWLAISPFIFRHAAGDTYLWAHDFIVATLVFLFAVLSWWQPTRHAHVLNLLAGLWLIAGAYAMAPSPAPAAYQNHVMVGLILLIFAVVPNDASLPSQRWRNYYARQAGQAPAIGGAPQQPTAG